MSSGKQPAIVPIGENHRRGISVTLTLLDEALCEIDQWAKGREVRSVLYQERNVLTPRQRKQLLSEVEEVRDVLQHLREDMGLEGKVQDGAARIWSLCAGQWEHLVELEGKHLRRYGSPPPQLVHYLEPKVAELIHRLSRISDLVHGQADETGARNHRLGRKEQSS